MHVVNYVNTGIFTNNWFGDYSIKKKKISHSKSIVRHG